MGRKKLEEKFVGMGLIIPKRAQSILKATSISPSAACKRIDYGDPEGISL